MKIEFLKIFTSNPEAQFRFYGEVLGLPVKWLSEDAFRVEIGFSILEFEKDSAAKPYHVAFHIPPQKESEALEWLEERLKVLQDGEDKIVDFPAWQAKSIYFYDRDNNILEFISREHLYEPSSEEFSAESILGISEIGLATTKVEENFNFLNTNFGLTKFSGNYEIFCATGDDEGLFIIIDRNKKDWIPTGDKAFPAAFEIKLSVKNALFAASYRDERLTLL